MNERHQLGVPIFVRVFWIYSFAFAVSASAMSIAATDILPGWLNIFLFMFGLFSALTSFHVGKKELDAQTQILNVQLDRDRAEIARATPKPVEDKNPGRFVHTVRITHRDESTGLEETKDFDFKPDEIPVKEFVTFCHNFAASRDDRHVPEREIAKDPTWGYRSNTWLGTMEQVGILVRENHAPNGARMWNDEIDIDTAFKMFGYALTKERPEMPYPTGLSVPSERRIDA